MQHIQYKHIKIWSGDCGASAGSDETFARDEWDPAADGGGDGTRAYRSTADASTALPSGATPMELADLVVTSQSIETDCVVYTAKNDSDKICLTWGLDVQLNPGMFASMKDSQTATHDEQNDETGAPLPAMQLEIYHAPALPSVTACALASAFRGKSSNPRPTHSPFDREASLASR